jgi:hypothetical protein
MVIWKTMMERAIARAMAERAAEAAAAKEIPAQPTNLSSVRSTPPK